MAEHVEYDAYESPLGDVYQAIRRLGDELSTLRRRIDGHSEEIAALRERVAELEAALAGASPAVPTAIANLYARTEQLERRANALPASLVQPPIGLPREEYE